MHAQDLKDATGSREVDMPVTLVGG